MDICLCLVSNQTKMSNFHPFEVLGRGLVVSFPIIVPDALLGIIAVFFTNLFTQF